MKKFNSKGRHLLIDCIKVSKEVCEDDRTMLKVIASSAEKAGATVINQVRYRLGHNSPPGFTCMVLLDESHISCHTYSDEGKMALDIFTCGNTDPNDVLYYIKKEINLGIVYLKEVERFI